MATVHQGVGVSSEKLSVLAWAASRYFDCIPGELSCRCGHLILGRSESVFPCVTEQAAEGWREE